MKKKESQFVIPPADDFLFYSCFKSLLMRSPQILTQVAAYFNPLGASKQRNPCTISFSSVSFPSTFFLLENKITKIFQIENMLFFLALELNQNFTVTWERIDSNRPWKNLSSQWLSEWVENAQGSSFVRNKWKIIERHKKEIANYFIWDNDRREEWIFGSIKRCCWVNISSKEDLKEHWREKLII